MRFALILYSMGTLRSFGAIALLSFASSFAAQSEAPSSLTPDAKNLEAWANFIRPNDDELSYEKIGWRSSFWPAIEEARRLGRPVLLWTMNGHPLGCT